MVKGDSLWIEPGDWLPYEQYVLGNLRSKFPNLEVLHNQKIMGKKSKIRRQIDILAISTHKIIIDCKYYSRTVDVKHVEMFLGMLDDIGVDKGIIVTSKGFTKSAINRAKNDKRNIDLSIISPDRLSDYQFFATAAVYRGEVGISFDRLPGWAFDTETSTTASGPLVVAYPLGMKRSFALQYGPMVYANILHCKGRLGMEALAKEHQNNLLADHPNATFQHESLRIRDKSGVERYALLRTSRFDHDNIYAENALYVIFNNFALIIAGNSLWNDSNDIRKMILSMYEESFLLKIST